MVDPVKTAQMIRLWNDEDRIDHARLKRAAKEKLGATRVKRESS